MNKTYNPLTTRTKHDPGGQWQKPNSFLIDSMDHSSQLRAFDEINPYFRKWIEFTYDKKKLFGHQKTEIDKFQNKMQNGE